MKRLKYLVGGVIAASVLVGCISSEEAGEVENVNIKSASELYGTWRISEPDLCGLGGSCEHYAYVLRKDAAYYIDLDIAPDSSSAAFGVLPVKWSLSGNKAIHISPNIPYFIGRIFQGMEHTSYRSQVKGVDSASVYTVSNIDSIVEAVNLSEDGSSTLEEEYSQVPDSLNFVIIQHNSRNDEEGERIHTVLESCYKDHANAKNLKDLCDVTIYEKDDLLDVDGILSQVDTVSSTEIWEDLLN